MAVDDSYPLFPSEIGPAPLIDHVGKRHEPRDTGLDDVRSAWHQVSANETEQSYAEQLGADGVNELLHFHGRVREVGPMAAREAAHYYSTRPRSAPVQEEEVDDRDDYRSATKAALRAEKVKAQREEQMPAAYAGLAQLKSTVGSLDPVVADYIKWGKELRQDPNSWQQVAHDVAGRMNEANGMEEAARTLTAFEKRHHIDPDTRQVMQRMLLNGEAHDLPTAFQFAKHELALDIKDPYQRAVVSAERRAEAPAMALAKAEVAAFRRAVQSSREVEVRMRTLLEKGSATSLQQAYEMAKR